METGFYTVLSSTLYIRMSHNHNLFAMKCHVPNFSGYKGVILGDGGYPLRHYILIPFKKTSRKCEEYFNKAHRKTRSKIEHTLGILKAR